MKTKLLTTYNLVINSGISNHVSDFDKKRIRVVNLFLLLSMGVILSFCVLNIILGFPILVLLDLLMVILIFTSFIFNYFQKWNVSKIILLYVLVSYIVIFPMFFGDIGTEYYNFVFLILGFYIIDRKRNLILLTLYITVLFSFSKYLINTVSYPVKYEILESVHYYPCIVSSALLVGILVSLFKFDTENFQKKLEQNQKELNIKIIELVSKDDLNKSLIKELNHRVKNNLQLISGLFTMQSYSYKNPEILEILNDTRNRIDAITILHQHLYKNNKVLEPDVVLYVNELAKFIEQAFNIKDKLRIRVFVEKMILTIENTLHIGLIINELLTNAIKYGGSATQKENNVKIDVKSIGGKVQISVSDSGMGFSEDFSIESNNSFGLELVNAISQQYNGVVELKNEEGAQVQVTLCI